MPITVSCPSCRKTLKAPDNAAGRKVRCPGCGTALAIPVPQKAPAPFEDSPVPTPATPRPRAKTPNRIILFAAIGGGVLVALVLIAVVIALIKGNTYPPSEVHVKVTWKTPAGIKPDLNPAAVFIPKGSREKINAVVPIAAGRKEYLLRGIILKFNPYVVPVEEVGAADIGYQARFDLLSYQDRFGPEYKRSKAYFSAVSMNGDLMLDVPEGEYTLIVFGNGPEEDKGVVIAPAEASKAEATLREFFAPDAIVGQLLGGTKMQVRQVQVKRGRVEFKFEFDLPQAQAAAKPPQEKREEVKIDAEKDAANPAERAAEEAVKKADAIKINPSDLAVSNAKLKFGGKVVEITAVVEGVRKGRYDDKTGERIIIDLKFEKKPEFESPQVACSFSLRHADILAKVRPGQTVTIRGRCDESLPNFLWHCYFVDH